MNLIRELVARAAPPCSSRITALDHEVFDDAMEHRAVVETLACQEHEVVDGLGRLVGVQFNNDVATRGLDAGAVLLLGVNDEIGRGLVLF